MKTISVSVSDEDYQAFQRIAKSEGRSVARMIREAMAAYRANVLEKSSPLRTLPVLVGHRALLPLPDRNEVYDEIFGERS
jgi:hypothetical protein